MARLQRAGFPHSDIRGSKAVRASPRLFAACRVLPRLREPRHPPCALWYLSRTITPVPPPPGAGRFEYPRSLLELVFLSFHTVKEPSRSRAQRGEQGIRTLDPRLAEPMLWPAELAPPSSSSALHKKPRNASQRASRKEVFQPHLPVRLPCYDLAPVTEFALGRVRPRLQAPTAPMA